MNSICGFVSGNLFILRLEIYINVTKKIVFLGFKDINVAECAFFQSQIYQEVQRQFPKSYLSGGLYKMPIRSGLDLGRKISIKILSLLMQKLGFKNYFFREW